MRNIRTLLAVIGAAFVMLAPAVAVAGPTNVFEEVCREGVAANSAACEPDGRDPLTGANGVIARVTNVVAVIAGILAVIVIIWGGFTYVTSGGDSGKTTSARNTIIYAAIGLVIIVLAQTIIVFVLNNI